MKTSISITKRLQTLGGALLALALGHTATALRADFVTGFETSSGYTAGALIVGTQDAAAPAGNTWEALFSTDKITVATDKTASGTQTLKIDDTTSSAYGVKLDLGSSVDFTRSFTFSFSIALDNIGSGTGNVAQIYLGEPNTVADGRKFWAVLYFAHDGNIYMQSDSSTGKSIYAVSLGSYQGTYGRSPGEFLDISMTIDASTKKYTQLSIGGQDETSVILSSQSGGTIPWLHDTPGTFPKSYLSIVAGGATTGTIRIDNVSITNIPEPSAMALASGLVGALLSVFRFLNKPNVKPKQ